MNKIEITKTGQATELPEINIEEIKNHVGSVVCLRGIIYKIRLMSGFAFVLIKIKGKLIQFVYSAGFSDFAIDELKDNMSVEIRGKVIGDERSKTGCEIHMLSCKILSSPVEAPPVVINNKSVDASIDTLLNFRPVTLRNTKESAVFKVQEGLCRGFRSFLFRNNFTEVHTPKLVCNGAEGGANVFKLDYFGREAYLAQSPQLYKQILVGVYERVFEIAPVFRAEKHDTSRHINEYISVDLEMGFIESFYDIMRTETAMISDTLGYLKERYHEELSLLNAVIPDVTQIPVIGFGEAKTLISQTYKREITDYDDFEPEEEKLLCEIIKKNENSDFVFVTHYRSSKRPFYAKNSPQNPDLTESFDLLFRGTEVTTGGQRINDYKEQTEKMISLGMDIKPFESYLMAHKYGLPPHGGLGLGLERFTAQILRYQNIRYASLFPRDINRLQP